MENVGRCSKCNKFLIEETASQHDCWPAFKQVVEIPVLYYFETEDKNIVIAKGWNGNVYRLVKSETSSIHYPTKLTPKRSDGDLTEPLKPIP